MDIKAGDKVRLLGWEDEEAGLTMLMPECVGAVVTMPTVSDKDRRLGSVFMPKVGYYWPLSKVEKVEG